MRLSIRAKLVLAFLAAAALSVAVTIGAILALAFSLLAQDPDLFRDLDRARGQAAALGQVLAAGGGAAEVRQAALAPGLPAGRRVQVVAMDGTVWVDTAGGEGQAVDPRELLRWLPVEGRASGPVVSTAIFVDDQVWGFYAETRAIPAQGVTLSAAGQSPGWALLGGQAAALLASLLLFWFIGRHLVLPIRRLSAVVSRIAAGDLAARTDLGRRGDELGQLARSVDSMAEQLQAAREQAAAAERARRFMVAAISHDLRTPLTALLANVEAIRSGIADDPRRSLAVVEDKGLLLKALIDDLFELAALDAQPEPWPLVRRDLAEVVRQAVAGAWPELEAAGLAVEVEIPETPCWAGLAPGKLERVLDNLLDNARKYGAGGGWLGVEVTRRAGWIRVTVANRGPAIPPEDLERLFDRYYRTAAARSGGARGSGLGLAVAREIVQRLGGRIGVESPPEGGARFWFELPPADEPAA